MRQPATDDARVTDLSFFRKKRNSFQVEGPNNRFRDNSQNSRRILRRVQLVVPKGWGRSRMSAGILATAWMCLVLSQSLNDVFYTNQRNHRIPVKLQEARRDEIRELMLFVSTDQGRTWSQGAASVAPEKDASFALYTKGDGLHWLRVVTVSR